MSNQYHRLLDARELTDNWVQDSDAVFDAGGYRVLEFQFRVLSSGTAGTLKVQHAAVNEPEAFTDLASMQVGLSATANLPLSCENFLRFLRCVTTGSVAGNPVAMCDVVAKN